MANTTIPAAPPTKERATHIEVVARIRPLQISMQSSSSYFGGTELPPAGALSSTATRKPPIPNSRIGMGTSSKKTTEENNETVSLSPEELFYAWEVNADGDTATQSHRTNIIQGRTHTYTLDKVYDAAASTKQVYEQSVKPLVSAAMEGTCVCFLSCYVSLAR